MVHAKTLMLQIVVLACLISIVVSVAVGAEPVSYRLERRDGRVVIVASTGEAITWSCFSQGHDLGIDQWVNKHRSPIEAGIHLYQLQLWDTKGQYWANPFTSLDGKPVVEPVGTITWRDMPPRLLERDPDARFLMRFTFLPDPAWRSAHLDQYPAIATHGGGANKDGRSIIPSLASASALQSVERNLRDAVAWCEKQPWRDRVVGYTLFIYGEGVSEVALCDETFDNSPVMAETFREFLKQKYRSDEALRTAWNDSAVTLATAAVPTKGQWLEKRQRLALKHWPDPALVRREQDYFLLQKQLYHRFWTRVFDVLADATRERPVIKACDSFKQHMLGWLHDPSFTADWFPGTMDHYNNLLLASGATGCGPVLDHPGLDMLQTPGMYYNRTMGFAWEAEGLSDSMTLRGKVNFMEADMRTWTHRDWSGKPHPPTMPIADAGVFMNPREMQAGFDRTLAWALSRNQMYYYAAVCGGNWWFDEPPVTETMAGQTRLIRQVGLGPWHETLDAICLVVDDDSPIHEDFSTGFQHLAVQRQMEEGLALCGVPYRIHLLSDLARDDFPAYKCYLFPNLYSIDAGTEKLLREKVLCKGRVAVFGPGTGITDGKKLSGEAASRLLGVDMQILDVTCARRVMLQDHGHAISKRLTTQTFGESYAYGPLLVPSVQRLPEDSSVRSLGAGFYHYFLDRPGPFVHDFGRGGAGGSGDKARGKEDYAVVFTPAVPMPAELLREIARHAGCHIWSEENAVIYANREFVALHTTRSGEHVLHLPHKSNVWDLNTNERIATDQEKLRLTIIAPETRMFRFVPSSETLAQ